MNKPPRPDIKIHRPERLYTIYNITDKRERESEQKCKSKIVNVAEKTFGH